VSRRGKPICLATISDAHVNEISALILIAFGAFFLVGLTRISSISFRMVRRGGRTWYGRVWGKMNVLSWAI